MLSKPKVKIVKQLMLHGEEINIGIAMKCTLMHGSLLLEALMMIYTTLSNVMEFITPTSIHLTISSMVTQAKHFVETKVM